MGFIKDAKVNAIQAEAKKRMDEGSSTFVATLNMPASRHGVSGEVADWSLMMDAVSGLGWRLFSATGMQDKGGKPQLVAVWIR